jgi:hypothetical protein
MFIIVYEGLSEEEGLNIDKKFTAQEVKTRLRLKRRVFPSNLPWQPRCRFSDAKLGRRFCAPPFQVVCPFRFRRNVPTRVSVDMRKPLEIFVI